MVGYVSPELMEGKLELRNVGVVSIWMDMKQGAT